MLDAEYEVDSATLELFLIDAKVPRRHLEAVQQVCWYFIIRHTCIHYITHTLHLELLLLVGLHEIVLEKHLFIKELFVTGKLFETFRNLVVAIADKDNEKVVFGEIT